MWYVYMLECKDGSIYTGITNKLERRLAEHKKKTSHYTSYNPPKEILFKEPFQNKLEAEKLEAQIKRWSHAKKLALIKGDLKQLRKLSRSRD